MSTIQSPVSDMLVTVKSREVQRGLAAEMSGQADEARQHFLAAAHLELVLAGDYEQLGDSELSRRSRIGAATCLFRAGNTGEAESLFQELVQSDPSRTGEIDELLAELKSSTNDQ